MHSWFTSPSSPTLPIISGTCREQRAAATWHISTRTSPSWELFYSWHCKVRDAIRLMDTRHARKDLAPGVTPWDSCHIESHKAKSSYFSCACRWRSHHAGSEIAVL